MPISLPGLKRHWSGTQPSLHAIRWVVLIAGLLITLLVSQGQWRLSRREHERRERVLADDITAALTSRLATNQAILAAVVGLFEASEEVTAAEFARFHRALTVNNANLAGIQGVGYAAIVPSEERKGFGQGTRHLGQPTMRFAPPGQRPLISRIVALQPADWRNARAMGFDMLSERNRRQAMERAALTGETVLSAPVRLLQETEERPQVGALLYAPIYAGTGEFASASERWRRLRGWAFSPLRIGDLVASALQTVANPDRAAAAVSLFDGDRPMPERLLYASPGLREADGAVHTLHLESITWAPLQLAHRSWLLGVQLNHPQPDLATDQREMGLAALLGVCLSVLAAVLSARLVSNHLALRRGLEREAQAARERALAAAVFDSSPVGIVVTDPNGLILRVNGAFTQISGYSSLEARGHKTNLLRSGRHDALFYQQMWEAIVQRGHWSGEIWNRHRNGNIRRHELNITAVLDGQDQIVQFVGLLRDVTERYSQDRRMRRLATHDPLTGLANRTLLMEELQRALAQAHRSGQAVGVLFLDLNGFKAVNDLHGHSCGDSLLQAVAQRLQRQVRAGDLLCHHGGDEFVLLIADAPSCDQLGTIATKLRDAIEAPFPGLPEDLSIGVSVGVARWPEHADEAAGLLEAADAAMYVAKQSGGDHVAVAPRRFEPSAAPGPRDPP